MIIRVKKLLQESDRRRTALEGGATADSMTVAQRLGMIFLTYMNIYRDSHHNGCQHRQREELTQHAVVRPCCRGRYVTVAMMMHAVATFSVNYL